MRFPCIDCARKHLAQATVLLGEVHLGYPDHIWIAIGHLAEASDELISDGRFDRLANMIRSERIQLMRDHGYRPVLMKYIEMITALTRSFREGEAGEPSVENDASAGDGYTAEEQALTE